MGESSNLNIGGWGIVLFLILMFWWVGGNGGFGNRGNAAPPFPQNGCNVVSNCQVEKQEIIDTARTQYLVEQTARATQDATAAGISSINNKIDNYAVQDLRDKLAEARNQNMMLQNRLYSDNKFNELSRQNDVMFCNLKQEIASLACEVPKRPPYFAAGAFANNGGCCNGLNG